MNTPPAETLPFQPATPVRRRRRAAAFFAPEPPPPPPPPPPPGPAQVVSTAFSGTTVNLFFDRPIASNGNPPDDAITVNGVAPTGGAVTSDPPGVALFLPFFAEPGQPWAIAGQPAWIDTEITWPQAGTL